jgi:hypothetical protein
MSLSINQELAQGYFLPENNNKFMVISSGIFLFYLYTPTDVLSQIKHPQIIIHSTGLERIKLKSQKFQTFFFSRQSITIFPCKRARFSILLGKLMKKLFTGLD